MDIGLLGPLEARDSAGRPLKLGGGKQRALLAVLLLNLNRTVSVETLVDDLWGENVPETATKAVQIYVSQLRKVLPRAVLQTRAPGYVIELPEEQVDLYRFERLLAAGRSALAVGNPGRASELLGEALALWRGRALGEFDEPFAEHEGRRLEERRLAALEERIEADLALGKHADLVGELEALVGRNPLRERLRGQQMLALYRCGRQADALAAYQHFRGLLDEQLGIEPSGRLKQLERQILQQDPELEPAGSRAATLEDGSRPRLPDAHGPAETAATVNARPEPVLVGRDRELQEHTAVLSAAAHPAAAALGHAPVRYAKSGDLNIAYQATGAGPVDLVLVSGFVSHLEKDWEEPRHAQFLDRLGSFSRLIRFDKRGTGLSDRPGGLPDLETRMDDVRAVMDEVGCERAVLFGCSEGGPMSILFAATYPERVLGLVLFGVYAKRLDPDDDYPWAPTREARRAYLEELERDWGVGSDMKIMCPSADEAMARWWGERCRAAASPGAVRTLMEMNSLIDVREVLPSIHVPTLVVHRGTDVDMDVEEGRYVSERIPGARFVELPGADHFVAIDPDQILDVVEPFVGGLASSPTPEPGDQRVLATILITDVVGSTAKAVELGDRAWSALLERHDEQVRGTLVSYTGELVNTAGDGSLALFDGPSRAIRCALALRDRLERLGLAVRAGVHTGEIERRGKQARGIAVHVAARVAAEAGPGEVLVTATTRDLVAGSGLEFADRGVRRLKGLDETRHLFAVAA